MNKPNYFKPAIDRRIGYCLVLLTLILSSCVKDTQNPVDNGHSLASARSIFINNGKLLITGYANNNDQMNSKYWVDGESVDQSSFDRFTDDGTSYREATDSKYRTVQVYKNKDGQNQKYQFDQGSLAYDGKIFFYKNDSINKIDTLALGTVSSISFFGDKPYYAGYFGKIKKTGTGEVLSREAPFIWDGNSFWELPLPDEVANFQGVSCLSVYDQDEFYLGGLGSLPMYWKGTQPIVLDTRYGEVWQIIKSGADVYAVGLINKNGSNSTGHTACYWKNEKRVELEDDAQAYGIFVDGDDVYVSGATGHVPVQYRPCFWKNGVRVDLPFN